MFISSVVYVITQYLTPNQNYFNQHLAFNINIITFSGGSLPIYLLVLTFTVCHV